MLLQGKTTGAWARVVGLVLILSLTGGHWMLLQSVAWARMLVNYSRVASFQTAVVHTFDGNHPCSMCKQIQQAKQSSRQEMKPSEAPREPHFFEAAPGPFFERPWAWLFAGDAWSPPERNEPPPTPPPRAIAGSFRYYAG